MGLVNFHENVKIFHGPVYFSLHPMTILLMIICQDYWIRFITFLTLFITVIHWKPQPFISFYFILFFAPKFTGSVLTFPKSSTAHCSFLDIRNSGEIDNQSSVLRKSQLMEQTSGQQRGRVTGAGERGPPRQLWRPCRRCPGLYPRVKGRMCWPQSWEQRGSTYKAGATWDSGHIRNRKGSVIWGVNEGVAEMGRTRWGKEL